MIRSGIGETQEQVKGNFIYSQVTIEELRMNIQCTAANLLIGRPSNEMKNRRKLHEGGLFCCCCCF